MDVGRIAEQSTVTHATAPKTAAEETTKKDTTLASDNADKYVKSETTYTPGYTKKTASKQTESTTVKFSQSVKSLKNEQMQSMVSSVIGKQSKSTAPTTSFSTQFTEALKAAEATSANTDDYWGSDATADRIFTFAKTLAGDNDELFDTLKGAFEKGFGQAEGKKGGKGKLPSVCYDTYDKVMSKFDDWEKEINSKSTSTEAADETTTATK